MILFDVVVDAMTGPDLHKRTSVDMDGVKTCILRVQCVAEKFTQDFAAQRFT